MPRGGVKLWCCAADDRGKCFLPGIKTMDTAATNVQWVDMCQSALSHAASIRRMQYDGRSAALIDDEVKKFTVQPVPKDEAEHLRRQSQHLAITSRIGAISQADSMLRLQHHAAARKMINADVGKLVASPLPNGEAEVEREQIRCLALASRMGTIAHADSMAKMHVAVADTILEHVRLYCEGPLPETTDQLNHIQLGSLTLTSTIAGLCHSDALSVMTGSFKDEPAFDEITRLGREITNTSDFD